ncbi:MAG: putative ABC exporter domain-containing protein [Cellulosilyticaceae bacterium]
MNALKYLCITTLKNHIKQLRHNPAKLILYVFCLLLVGFMLWTGFQADIEVAELRPLPELGAVIFGFLGFVFITPLFSGLESGSSFFGMSDVNLLFVSPTSSKLILFYGLIRQATLSVILSFFILFQFTFLKTTYGVNLTGLIAIFIGYLVLLLCGQVISMLIYMFSNNNPSRKRIVKFSLYLIVSAPLLVMGMQVLQGISPLQASVSIANSTILEYVPFLGWIKAIMYGVITGDLLKTVLFSVITLIGFSAMIGIILKYNIDYFEDVLKVTEHTAALKSAAKEGKITDRSSVTSKKIKNFGLTKGHGASVLFYKHKLENTRTGFGPFNNMTLLSLVITIIMGVIFAKNISKPYQLLVLLGILTYLQVFTIGAEKWSIELTFPYIYLMPVSPFKKLLYCLSYDLLRAFLEAILLFVPIGLFLQASPITILFCIVARTSFELLFMSGNVLGERIFGTILSKGLLLLFYFFLMIILACPGIIGTVIMLMSSSLPSGLSLIICILWNLIVSTLIFFCCRTILSNVELRG